MYGWHAVSMYSMYFMYYNTMSVLTAIWTGLKLDGAMGTSVWLLSGANSIFSISLAGGGAGKSSSPLCIMNTQRQNYIHKMLQITRDSKRGLLNDERHM